MTDGSDLPPDAPARPKRVRHDEEVARQMRLNLKKRKAFQRALRERPPPDRDETDGAR